MCVVDALGVVDPRRSAPTPTTKTEGSKANATYIVIGVIDDPIHNCTMASHTAHWSRQLGFISS